MKVCLLSKMYPPVKGGSGKYAYELATALGKRGHDVDVYTQSKQGEEPDEAPNDNVTVFTITKARRRLVTFETIYYSLRARSAVDFDTYDVIHGTLMPASTIALSDRVGIGNPIVLTSHSFAPSNVRTHSTEIFPDDYLLKFFFHPMNAVMDATAARAASRIIAISTQMQEQLVSYYRLPAERVDTIGHGVDTNRFHPRQDSHPAVSENKLTVLFVGRLISLKGVDLAIKSLSAIENPNVELLIAGTGRLRNQLEQLAIKLGVCDQVRFLGYISGEELTRLYSSSDVTLFTSRYEGFGLVFMESLASGTPVIGAPIGGFPDLVTDGREGFLVDRDPEAIGRTIEKLADTPDRTTEMGRYARQLAETRTWDTVAAETEAVYESVVEKQ